MIFCLTPQEMIQFNLHVQMGKERKDSASKKKTLAISSPKKQFLMKTCVPFFWGGVSARMCFL